MRSLIKPAAAAWLLAGLAAAAVSTPSFTVAGDDAGSWPAILSSIGFTSRPGQPANVFIVRSGAPADGAELLSKVDQGAFLILEGESELAASLGFRPGKEKVVVRSEIDARAPKLEIIWEHALELPRFELPAGARIFARERWTGAPLMAAVTRKAGAVLWIAAPPGEQGYERFPYLLQALCDLGLQPPARAARIWAFFDSAYRSRVDLDYFAARWRRAGIAALQVAAWHYWEPDPQGDEYLRRLITACHKQGILVYAWLELPHVSEKFWADHPEWREKTAILQDAQLDWRKLMNLENPAASAEVEKGARRLLGAFDWDGANLAELYFESLEGAANPARFTPMNPDVRKDFQASHGIDPLELFSQNKPDPKTLQAFLDYRAGVARQLQQHWIGVMESIRTGKPDLDLVLTHVDDRFDTRMHDLIGADASRVLPLMSDHRFTFLIEDPATIWNLGPQRYPQIASRYEPLTRAIPGAADRLAIDINIVERYQDVYPTKQQTGTELFELVHLAAQAFPRVALYFENSILPPDLPLLPAAQAGATQLEPVGDALAVKSAEGVGVAWKGPAKVDGKLWPVRDDGTVWLPAGAHAISAAEKDTPFRMAAFNGQLKSAAFSGGALEFSYASDARAIATLTARPARVEIDGEEISPEVLAGGDGKTFALLLPRGQHLVAIRQGSGARAAGR